MISIKKIKKSTLKQIVILCFLGVTVWAVNFYFHPDVPSSSDAAVYASMTRSIVKGQGWIVPTTIPDYLTYSLPPSPSGWPPFYSYLYPLTVVPFFLFFGVRDFSLALTSGFFFVLTLPFLYLLTKKIFNRQVAILSSVWYIFTPSLLSYSNWGVPESFYVFLITLGFFLLFVYPKCLFWTGAVFALVALTKFQGILFIPLLVLYIFKTQKARSPLLLFLGGFALIMILKSRFLPPLAIDYANFQNQHLWSAMAQGAIFPFGELGRTLTPATLELILTNPDLIVGKVITNSYYFLQKFFNLALPPVTVLYSLSFFKPDPSKIARNFKFLSLTLILVFLPFHLVTFFDFRYLHPLLPLVITLAAATFLPILKYFNPKKILLFSAIFTFLFIIVPCFTSPSWGSSIKWAVAQPRKPTFDSLIGKVAQANTPPEAIIVTNSLRHMGSVAWYGNRRSILLPLNLTDLQKIDEDFVPVNFLLLVKVSGWPPLEPEWEELIENPHDFDNFRLVKKSDIQPQENYHQTQVKIVLYRKKLSLNEWSE